MAHDCLDAINFAWFCSWSLHLTSNFPHFKFVAYVHPYQFFMAVAICIETGCTFVDNLSEVLQHSSVCQHRNNQVISGVDQRQASKDDLCFCFCAIIGCSAAISNCMQVCYCQLFIFHGLKFSNHSNFNFLWRNLTEAIQIKSFWIIDCDSVKFCWTFLT